MDDRNRRRQQERDYVAREYLSGKTPTGKSEMIRQMLEYLGVDPEQVVAVEMNRVNPGQPMPSLCHVCQKRLTREERPFQTCSECEHLSPFEHMMLESLCKQWPNRDEKIVIANILGSSYNYHVVDTGYNMVTPLIQLDWVVETATGVEFFQDMAKVLPKSTSLAFGRGLVRSLNLSFVEIDL